MPPARSVSATTAPATSDLDMPLKALNRIIVVSFHHASCEAHAGSAGTATASVTPCVASPHRIGAGYRSAAPTLQRGRPVTILTSAPPHLKRRVALASPPRPPGRAAPRNWCVGTLG